MWNVIAIEVDLDAPLKPRVPGNRSSGHRTYALVEAGQLHDPGVVLEALRTLHEGPDRRATMSAMELLSLFRETGEPDRQRP